MKNMCHICSSYLGFLYYLYCKQTRKHIGIDKSHIILITNVRGYGHCKGDAMELQIWDLILIVREITSIHI